MLSSAQLSSELADPVSELNKRVAETVSRFSFERAMTFVGRSSANDAKLDENLDEDIHDGTILTAHGYARLARHKPTGAVCLIASKASLNLKGKRDADGSIRASKDDLGKSYIVAAYRTSGKDEDIYTVSTKLKRALRRFNEDLGERSEKHFTLYGADISKEKEGGQREIYTNGRLAYLIEEHKGKYKVSFHAPTKRRDGSFVPIKLGTNSLSERFASVSKVIASADNYEQARHDMSMHWQRVSSKLWDEKSIYEGEGFGLIVKKNIAQIFNHVAEKGLQITLVTAAIGLGMGLISAKYGIIGGLLAAITHTFAHHILDESYHASSEAIAKTKEAQRRLNIEAYPENDDVSNHFKIQTTENISKLCSKIDLERFDATDFEFLTTEQSHMLLDHEKKVDGFRSSSLRAHLLYVHQRGFSSSCTLPDDRTRLDIFQSGLVRLMHEKEDGTIVIYSRYRPDACLDENLRLPEDKIERMGTEIIKFEYDRRREDFHHSFRRTPGSISLEDMIKDLQENLLFKNNAGINGEDARQSLEAIKEAFSLPKEAESKLYMNGHPSKPARLAAVSPAP